MNFILISLAISLLVTGQIASVEQPQLDVDPSYRLKPGNGVELVQANCMPCHSTAIVAANHMSREGWSKTIDIMQQKNGMWPLPRKTRNQILDYLENAQRVKDKGLEEGKQSPWATPLYQPNPLWD